MLVIQPKFGKENLESLADLFTLTLILVPPPPHACYQADVKVAFHSSATIRHEADNFMCCSL